MTRVKIPHWNLTPDHDSTLKSDPRSWFHVELWPLVWIQRWIVTPTHESTLNCDLGLGSQFNVEFWPWVIIQHGILTRGHNSTWNFDPGSQFNVEFWPVYISSIRGIVTQEGVEIQQRDQNSTAKEGHNSTKNPLNIHPGWVRGSKFYLTPEYSLLPDQRKKRLLTLISHCSQLISCRNLNTKHTAVSLIAVDRQRIHLSNDTSFASVHLRITEKLGWLSLLFAKRTRLKLGGQGQGQGQKRSQIF